MKKKLALYKTKAYKYCHDGFCMHKALFFHFISFKNPAKRWVFVFYRLQKNHMTHAIHATNGMTHMTSPHDLPKAISPLQRSMVHLVERQSVLMDKLDGFVMKVMAHEERLKCLEDSLLTHVECATWVKATIRFWPVLVAGILLLLGHQVH